MLHSFTQQRNASHWQVGHNHGSYTCACLSIRHRFITENKKKAEKNKELEQTLHSTAVTTGKLPC